MTRMLATHQKVLIEASCPDAMVAMTDALGEAAMKFCQGTDGAVAGRYVVEIRQDGSLLSMRACAERWEDDEGEPTPPTPEVLAAMYEQIVPSAEAYAAECGEKPPLAADMYDLFAGQGFDLSMVERVTDLPRITLQ